MNQTRAHSLSGPLCQRDKRRLREAAVSGGRDLGPPRLTGNPKREPEGGNALVEPEMDRGLRANAAGLNGGEVLGEINQVDVTLIANRLLSLYLY